MGVQAACALGHARDVLLGGRGKDGDPADGRLGVQRLVGQQADQAVDARGVEGVDVDALQTLQLGGHVRFAGAGQDHQDGAGLEGLAVLGLQVHRLAGTASENGVRKVLARLVEHGLVSATRAGASWMYEANRGHLAWPAVEQLIDMPTEFVRRLRAQVASWKVAPVCLGLFGSAARGDGSTSSDVDLLIVRPDDTGADHAREAHESPAARGSLDARSLKAAERRAATWEQQVQDLRQAVLAMTGNHAQVLELSTTALRNAVFHGEPIVPEWKQDLVLISGDAPWALVAGLVSRGDAALEVANPVLQL